MAVVMMTANATMPMNMLGKPKTELCQVCITWPQEIQGFTSQTVTWLRVLEDLELLQHQGAGREPADDAGDQQEPGERPVAGHRGKRAGPRGGRAGARWCTVASPAALEMLGMEYESFASGAPGPILSPEAGRSRDSHRALTSDSVHGAALPMPCLRLL